MSLTIPTITISGVSVVAVIGYVIQHRRYARSTLHKLGLESFPTYIWRGIGYRFAGVLQPRVAAQLSLRSFALNRLEASTDTIQVPAPVPVELSLDRMYVPLTALSTQQARVSAEQIAFGMYRYTLLVGDPGSGKTTLVRKIYRDLCRAAIISPGNCQIPVLIELKSLDDLKSTLLGTNDNESIFDLIRQEVVSVQTYAGEKLFDWFVNDGRLTVFLDGLDEINTEAFDAVSRDILALRDQLSRRNPKNRLVVTTRRQLYVNLSSEFASAFGTHLTLEPFTANDMYEFLTKWDYGTNANQHVVSHNEHKAHKASAEDRPIRTEEQVARIFANLADQPNIRTMCATPLVLAMYVAMDQLTKGQNLPETRPEFYRVVTDELLVRRRSRQFGFTAGLGLLRRNRQRILGRIALEHLLDETQSRNTLRWQSALDIICEEEGISPDDAETRLRELSRDTGLFTEERREESLRFIHLTFCEFLAAQAISSGASRGWTEITRRVSGSQGTSDRARYIERFAEVIVFATALESNDSIRRRRIRWVLQSDYVDVALRAIVDSQSYDDELVRAELDHAAESIACVPEEERDERWLYLFRQIAITLRDRERVLDQIPGYSRDMVAPLSLSSFVKKVIGDSATGLEGLFLSYVRVDPSGALQMARSMDVDPAVQYPLTLISVLDEPDILAHALAEFGGGGSSSREWGSLIAMATFHQESLATRLAQMPYEKKRWSEVLADNSRRTGWHQCWAIRNTMLGLILESGCRWPSSWQALQLMSQLRVPRHRQLEKLLGVSLLGWIFLIIVGFGGAFLPLSDTAALKGWVLYLIIASLAILALQLAMMIIGAFRSQGASIYVVGLSVDDPNRGGLGSSMGFLMSSVLHRLASQGGIETLNEDLLKELCHINGAKIRPLKTLSIIRKAESPYVLFSRIPVINWCPNVNLDIFALIKKGLVRADQQAFIQPPTPVTGMVDSSDDSNVLAQGAASAPCHDQES